MLSVFPSGREARADEDDGAGRFLAVPLLFLPLEAAGGPAVQAGHLGPGGGAGGGAVRQRGPGAVQALGGRAGARGVHGGDASGQGSGPPVIR